MDGAALPKVKAASAAEVCRQFDLAPEARPLLQDKQTPRQFLDALLAGRHYRAAVPFLAYALPAREAVWWGCLCWRHLAGSRPPAEAAACKAAAKWVLEPTEENRRAAEAAANAAGLATPAGSLALAAFWSGGSITPPNLPAVAPKPHMTPRAIAAALRLASVQGDPAKIPETLRAFVELGLGVAEGKVVWPEIKQKAPAKA
jgi:hypothetical protein